MKSRIYSIDICFQGKRTDNGEWVKGYFGVEDGSQFESPYGSTRSHIITKTSMFQVISESVGQYTGVLDMYGQEIYDHDLIEGDGIWEVVFINYGWCIRNKDGQIYRFAECDIPACKRIGNMFDNPELLV